MGEAKTYRTEVGAKRVATNATSPVIVELSNGTYDWFPKGHPLPQGAIIISQWVINQWREVKD